jgi:hypothetical protein
METKELKVKPVNTIQFDKNEDGELMQLVNNYTSVFNDKVMKRTSPRNAIRNFLIVELPKAIKHLTGGNGEQLANQI